MSAHGSDQPPVALDSVLQMCHRPPCQDVLTLFSGGAEGVDAEFDDAMARFAPSGQCIHWSYAGHRGFAARSGGRVDVPNKVSAALCDPHLRDAAKQLHQSVPRNWHVLNLFRRNVCQALWAEAMFAITWEDLDARYPLRIGGGTKWAAQVYVNRFQPHGSEPAGSCQLWLYEVNTAVWKKWDCGCQCWNLVEQPPSLSADMKFAGIGTKTPPAHAVQAIRDLFREVCCVQLQDSARQVAANSEVLGVRQKRADDGAAPSKQMVRRWRPKHREARAPAEVEHVETEPGTQSV
ncbi:unnamed protein product [Symbiodinium natans]|uniref:Uncharacterized protein n=1 Tax=Symbiodinium natans TaxID=878477 RepID=A0A812LJQ5_9DINO|nr:unnamed protein product [Symbiodinium natans]